VGKTDRYWEQPRSSRDDGPNRSEQSAMALALTTIIFVGYAIIGGRPGILIGFGAGVVLIAILVRAIQSSRRPRSGPRPPLI
jgi:hypothetical protein